MTRWELCSYNQGTFCKNLEIKKPKQQDLNTVDPTVMAPLRQVNSANAHILGNTNGNALTEKAT